MYTNTFLIFITIENQNVTFSQQLEKLTHSATKHLCKFWRQRVKLLLIQVFEDCVCGDFLAAPEKQLLELLPGITQGVSTVS